MTQQVMHKGLFASESRLINTCCANDDSFLLRRCTTLAATANDCNKNTVARVLLIAMIVLMMTLPGEAVCLSCFPGSPSGTESRPDILLQESPVGLLDALKGLHLQQLTANAR